MRVLGLTTIFPNNLLPKAAPFIRQQTVALSKVCDHEMLGVVPWFPGMGLAKRWTYAKTDFSKVAPEEWIEGVRVRHPRFLRVPRAHSLAAATYTACLLPAVAAERRRTDVVFATWAYPDGVAAITLGKLLGVPVVLQVIGSDINDIGASLGSRHQLRLALPHAAGVVAVSRPLAEAVVALGARNDRVHAIPTGVDSEMFRPRDRHVLRDKLGESRDARLIVFVGRMYEKKGVKDLLDAFEVLASRDARYRLVFVGDGPARRLCEERAHRLSDRLHLAGELPLSEVSDWLGACDVLTLPSHDEGTPNVVLEALASGRKVVATHVGGIPHYIKSSTQGELVPPRDPARLARALERVGGEPYDATKVAASVDLLGWDENARKILRVLEAAAASTQGFRR